MIRLALALLLVSAYGSLRAQQPPEQAATIRPESARIKALRETSKPLIAMARKQSAELAAIKRAHAAARKQLRESLSPAARTSDKGRKALSDLAKSQRLEWRKAVSSRRAEREKLEKKAPAAAKAFREFIKTGAPLEEPAK